VGAEATAKAFIYAATLLAVGTCTTHWSLTLRLRRIPFLPARSSSNPFDRELARVGLIASTLLVASLLVRLWAHTYSAFGWSESLTWNRLQLMALQSRWGNGWGVQILLALALTVTYLTMVIRQRPNWPAATIAALALSYALPLVGHGAGSNGRLVLHGTHILGAGVWLGSLAVLLIVRGQLPGHEALDVRRVFADFWTVATCGVALLLLGGVVIAVLYVESWSNLWATTYGRMLVLKLAIVGAIGLCGWTNWRRYRGPSRAETNHLIAVLEVALALTAVIVTSILTELEHP
jgi:putative copper export protein